MSCYVTNFESLLLKEFSSNGMTQPLNAIISVANFSVNFPLQRKGPQVRIFKVVPFSIGFAMDNESISLQRIEVIIDRLAIRLVPTEMLRQLILDF